MKKIFFIPIILLICSCGNAWKYAATSNQTINNYYLVTGNTDNFGDKRLTYIKARFISSELDNFLNCSCNYRGLPQFFFEYQTNQKKPGISLYYPKLDSVFVFEATQKFGSKTFLKEAKKNKRNRESYL